MNPRPSLLIACLLSILLSLQLLAGGCSFGPSLPEQEAMILDSDIRLRVLTLEAFLQAWGPPTYQSVQYTQFYPVENGSWIPQFRVPLGELPAGWKVTIISQEGHFLAYKDRGELLGFVDSKLVYRERLDPEEIAAIGGSWKGQALFRTRLEQGAKQ